MMIKEYRLRTGTLLLCVVLLSICSSSAAEKVANVKAVDVANETSKSDTLVVTARLVEIPGRFAPNDAYDYVYIMKYRIIKVEKGVCTDKEILVGHYNPLIARSMINDKMDASVNGTVEKFAVGEKHRLSLVAPVEAYWNGAIETEYYDTPLQTFFAVNADIIK